MINTKKTGSQGCVGKKDIIFHKFSVRNSGASSGDVRKLRVFENIQVVNVAEALCNRTVAVILGVKSRLRRAKEFNKV